MAKRKWKWVGPNLRPVRPPQPPRLAIDSREKAVAYLLQKLSPESREVVRNTKREDLIQFHRSSWGMGIRKELGLWGENVNLFRALSPDGEIHADDASMLLIYGVWDLLQEPAKNRPPKELVRQWLAWNNGTIRNLALSIRDGGQADLFPILADALEEAGCT